MACPDDSAARTAHSGFALMATVVELALAEVWREFDEAVLDGLARERCASPNACTPGLSMTLPAHRRAEPVDSRARPESV